MDTLKIAKYKEQIIDTLSKQIRIRSEKSEAVGDKPFGLGPYEALETFLEDASNLGFRTGKSGNYAGWAEFGPEGTPMVAAVCHLDVVPAPGWPEAYTPQVEEDKIIGRGTMDDKGPAVAVLYAMKSLMDEGINPPCRIRLILGTDEESGSQCMKHYVQHEEIPLAAFTADADFPVIHGEKGQIGLVLRYEGEEYIDHQKDVLVEAKVGSRANVIPGEAMFIYQTPDDNTKEVEYIGKMGHASMPQYAKNAIQLALAEAYTLNPDDPFLRQCKQFLGEEHNGEGLGIHVSDEPSGNLTLNVGIIDYERGHGTLTLDIRYPVTYRYEDLLVRVEKTLEGSNFHIESSRHSEPLYVPKEDILVQTLMKSYQKVSGRTDEPVVIGGGTYARSVPNTLAFGPCFLEDENLCHQKGEYITFESLFTAAEIYREALLSLAETYGKDEKKSI